VRTALIGGAVTICYMLSPYGLHGLPAAGVGFFVALVIILAELRLRHAEISRLVGGAVGAVVGFFAALLIALVLSRTAQSDSSRSFLEITALLALGYLGLALGSRKASEFRAFALPHSAEATASPATSSLKLLDTSVLIDGRIADICETHFLDGALGLPSFVLQELQMVADSSDALKRQRGRRGLDVLDRMQKMPGLEIRVLEGDLSGVSGVDQKLVELAKRSDAKIVTNDYNLNKVARIHGIAVLNVNELANAMKPAVLPGESMRVLILREGKEPSQGVAYLDDGTMVVVDGARRMLNRTVAILVTSVHQTPAGKMIFGRLDDRAESAPSHGVPGSPQVATSAQADAAGVPNSPSFTRSRPESADVPNGHSAADPALSKGQSPSPPTTSASS